jgi:hypothetical protein
VIREETDKLMGPATPLPNRALKIRHLVIGKPAFGRLLGCPVLKFRRHYPQSSSHPEIKGGSRQGNENFSLLTKVRTAVH